MRGKRNAKGRPREIPLLLPPHVRALLGDEAESLLEALAQPPPTSIRYNPLKGTPAEGRPVPWCPQGRYLDERPVFTKDPLFHAGAYYVQEASSMLLGQALLACAALPPDTVALDLCAAPGGKSTHLAALLPPQALLIANETVPARQTILSDNLWKWGRPDVVLTQATPEAFAPLGPFCDLIVVDAPCSGEGMFRKDPHARAQWGSNLVQTCALRQSHILDSAWPLLKPGGYLVYSTCTWETCENEDQVRRMSEKGAEVVELPVPPEWGVVAQGPGLRCYPHRLEGEGFFLAALRKPGGPREEAAGARAPAHAGSGLPEDVRGWVHRHETWAAVEKEGVLHVLSRPWAPLVEALAATVPVTSPGTPLAQRKGAAWMPHPALALSALCNHGAFTTLDLDAEAAIRYLRGEALPAREAAGTALVRHRELGLGWAQGAGNRWNNRWPTPWRIRMR